jgi:cell division protein FtsB
MTATASGGMRPVRREGRSAGAPRRPRLTGRAAVLVLVVAVLAVSYASSMKAYLQQRAHIEDLKDQIATTSAEIDDLEREKRRWNDDAYVRAQARERFGYVMPGETSYVVLDEDGKPPKDQPPPATDLDAPEQEPLD